MLSKIRHIHKDKDHMFFIQMWNVEQKVNGMRVEWIALEKRKGIKWAKEQGKAPEGMEMFKAYHMHVWKHQIKTHY